MGTTAIIIYGLLVVGYVAMLALTERGAARYVRGETRIRPQARIFIVAGAPAKPAPERFLHSQPGLASPTTHRALPERSAA